MGNNYSNNPGAAESLQKKNNQIQLPSNKSISNASDQYASVERSHPHCEQQEQVKKTLKFLYKNNFVSLTFEDLNVFVIQTAWRQYLVQRLKKKRMGMIDVIYSSIGLKTNIASRTEGVFLRLDIKKYPYRCYDLTVYKNLLKIVDVIFFNLQKLGGKDHLPMVFINNYYIGGADDFQMLEDRKVIGSLLKKEYEKRCMACNVYITSKNSTSCPFCYSSYISFARSLNQFDVYENRKDDKRRSTNNKNVSIKKK